MIESAAFPKTYTRHEYIANTKYRTKLLLIVGGMDLSSTIFRFSHATNAYSFVCLYT